MKVLNLTVVSDLSETAPPVFGTLATKHNNDSMERTQFPPKAKKPYPSPTKGRRYYNSGQSKNRAAAITDSSILPHTDKRGLSCLTNNHNNGKKTKKPLGRRLAKLPRFNSHSRGNQCKEKPICLTSGDFPQQIIILEGADGSFSKINLQKKLSLPIIESGPPPPLPPADNRDVQSERVLRIEKIRDDIRSEHERLSKTPSLIFLGEYILSNRLSEGQPLRAWFMQEVCNYIQAEVKRPTVLDGVIGGRILPYFAEVIMTVLYYDNLIFDGKGGTDNAHKIREATHIGTSVRNLAQFYVFSHPDLPLPLQVEFQKVLLDIESAVNEGQAIEANYNKYANWKSNSEQTLALFNSFEMDVAKEAIATIKNIIEEVSHFPLEKQAFLNNYLYRIYLTNAYLYVRIARFISEKMGGFDGEDNLIRFAVLFGMMHQIVNDIADFKPAFGNDITHTKDQNDALKDLKNKNITLPIMIHLLNTKNSKIKQYLDHPNYPYFNTTVYSDDICASSAIYITMAIGKEIQKKLPLLLNPNNIYHKYIVDATKVAENNRFYHYFYHRKEEAYYRKYQAAYT